MKKLLILLTVSLFIFSCNKKFVTDDPNAYNDSLMSLVYSIQYPMDSLQMHFFYIKNFLETHRNQEFNPELIDTVLLKKRYKIAKEALKKAKKNLHLISYKTGDKNFKPAIQKGFNSIDSNLTFVVPILIDKIVSFKGAKNDIVLDTLNFYGKKSYRMYSNSIFTIRDGQRAFDVNSGYTLMRNFVTVHL